MTEFLCGLVMGSLILVILWPIAKRHLDRPARRRGRYRHAYFVE